LFGRPLHPIRYVRTMSSAQRAISLSSMHAACVVCCHMVGLMF
jgi:hypothetical protein